MEHIEDKIFKGEDYTKKVFYSKVFHEVTFENCLFIESHFGGATFSSCLFKNCNLSLVNFEGSQLQDVTFQEGKVVGARFDQCQKRLFLIRAKETLFSSCNFLTYCCALKLLPVAFNKRSIFAFVCLLSIFFIQ